MMHPEHDPREKRRRMGRNGNRRNRYGDEEQQRRKQNDEEQGFSASMYDDDADALAARRVSRHNSTSTLSSDGSTRHKNSYRVNRTDRREFRDRSASPNRDGEKQDGLRSRRRRIPPPPYSSRDPYPFPEKNGGKELFPSKATSSAHGSSQPSAISGVKELFPNKTAAAAFKKELFPLKSGTSVHRRSDAFDAADETAALFATGMNVPFVDGSSDRQPTIPRSLADRIADNSRSTRIRSKPPNTDNAIAEASGGHQGFSIRGASIQQDVGFSIRGLASEDSQTNAVKELFPGKGLGNAGKELFSEKLQGRGGRRNKAIDMFY